jgi:hypothetical protein
MTKFFSAHGVDQIEVHRVRSRDATGLSIAMIMLAEHEKNFSTSSNKLLTSAVIAFI